MSYLKHLLLFTLLIILTVLIGCKQKVSQEAIQYQATTNLSTNFTINPGKVKKHFIEGSDQKINELIQGILLSKQDSSKDMIKEFSQLFAETYIKAMDSNLSESENRYYAARFGNIMGHLSILREQIMKQRNKRLFAKWYDYNEFDKRWLAMFIDITPLFLSEKIDEQVINIAKTGTVNEFVNALKQSEFAKKNNNQDLVDSVISTTDGTVTAKFNGYLREKKRNIRDTYDSSFAAVYLSK
jgi:hypothetical protein